MSVLIVGLSGVTNGGKSTICSKLMKILPSCTKMLKQDDYFLPEDSSLHIPCSEVQHHNWDIITSIDMDRMVKDIKQSVKSLQNMIPTQKLTSSLCSVCTGDTEINSLDINSLQSLTPTLRKCGNHRKILLIDGFIIFDDYRLRNMCELKFFFTLPKDECFARRQTRSYDPPDPPGYFEVCVWPMYEAHLERVKKLEGIHFYDGTEPMDDIFFRSLKKILHTSVL